VVESVRGHRRYKYCTAASTPDVVKAGFPVQQPLPQRTSESVDQTDQ
jgi:hypothetical protein